jgi:hypothetical protein
MFTSPTFPLRFLPRTIHYVSLRSISHLTNDKGHAIPHCSTEPFKVTADHLRFAAIGFWRGASLGMGIGEADRARAHAMIRRGNENISRQKRETEIADIRALLDRKISEADRIRVQVAMTGDAETVAMHKREAEIADMRALLDTKIAEADRVTVQQAAMAAAELAAMRERARAIADALRKSKHDDASDVGNSDANGATRNTPTDGNLSNFGSDHNLITWSSRQCNPQRQCC